MTAVIDRAAADAVTEKANDDATQAVKAPMHQTARPAEPDSGCATPSQQTFTIGTVTIEAHDEAEALRKYKRLVRAEALKAKDDRGWCVSGTNERLEMLGLRKIGQGVTMKVNVVATRTAYVSIDADDLDEAKQLVDSGDEATLRHISSTLSGGWKVTSVEAPDAGPLVDDTKIRRIGDHDDTFSGVQRDSGYLIPDQPMCNRRHGPTSYRCTMLAGHAGQHASGNSVRIMDVWDNRLPRPAASDEPVPVVGQTFDDFAAERDRCDGRSDGFVCTRHAGHSGPHAGAYADRRVGDVWED